MAGQVASRAVVAVDRQQWLDPLAERLQETVRGVFEAGGAAARRIKNVLHGTWLGHPLHPVLTDVPIGAWTAAVVLDARDAFSGSRRDGRAADTALTIGLVGAVGAAVTGLTDWQHTDGEPRRVGLAHALLNTAATALCVTSLVLRRRGARGGGRTTALLGFGVSMAAAYLGGHLVYRQRIGVDHSQRPEGPREFVPVLAASELREGQPRRVDVDGVGVLVVRRGSRVFAIGERCSHLGGPLAEGRLEGDSVRCPWHGSRFALADGSVLDGPATFPQPCFEVRIRNAQAELRPALPPGQAD